MTMNWNKFVEHFKDYETEIETEASYEPTLELLTFKSYGKKILRVTNFQYICFIDP